MTTEQLTLQVTRKVASQGLVSGSLVGDSLFILEQLDILLGDPGLVSFRLDRKAADMSSAAEVDDSGNTPPPTPPPAPMMFPYAGGYHWGQVVG